MSVKEALAGRSTFSHKTTLDYFGSLNQINSWHFECHTILSFYVLKQKINGLIIISFVNINSTEPTLQLKDSRKLKEREMTAHLNILLLPYPH